MANIDRRLERLEARAGVDTSARDRLPPAIHIVFVDAAGRAGKDITYRRVDNDDGAWSYDQINHGRFWEDDDPEAGPPDMSIGYLAATEGD